MWATCVPILLFLGLSLLDLGPMYATDVRPTDVRRQKKASFIAPPIRDGGIIIQQISTFNKMTAVTRLYDIFTKNGYIICVSCGI